MTRVNGFTPTLLPGFTFVNVREDGKLAAGGEERVRARLRSPVDQTDEESATLCSSDRVEDRHTVALNRSDDVTGTVIRRKGLTLLYRDAREIQGRSVAQDDQADAVGRPGCLDVGNGVNGGPNSTSFLNGSVATPGSVSH